MHERFVAGGAGQPLAHVCSGEGLTYAFGRQQLGLRCKQAPGVTRKMR
jgi:hypothetical protein